MGDVRSAGRIRRGAPEFSLEDALVRAVRTGNDTETVATIAGGLAGALYGASSLPAEWRELLHGWPNLRADDLVALSEQALAV